MKKIKFMAFFLSAALVFGSCGTMNNTAKGGIVGGGSGHFGAQSSVELPVKVKVPLLVLLSEQLFGGTAGVLIGRKMDKKAEEAARIEGAQVEQITDNNGLAAVKVTFDSGILFGFNSSTLSNTNNHCVNLQVY